MESVEQRDVPGEVLAGLQRLGCFRVWIKRRANCPRPIILLQRSGHADVLAFFEKKQGGNCFATIAERFKDAFPGQGLGCPLLGLAVNSLQRVG